MTHDDYNRTPEQRVEDEAINARDEAAEDERLFRPGRVAIENLTVRDIGRWVRYVPSAGKSEFGRIKSWNDKFVFVVYKCAGNWDAFTDYTAVATKPEDLEFRS